MSTISRFTKEQWFEEWDPKSLYEKLLEGVDQCSDDSPLKHKDEGIVCGPIVRLINVDYSKKVYTGSILIVTKNQDDNAPSIEFVRGPLDSKQQEDNQSLDLQTGSFESKLFHVDKLGEDIFRFFRYTIAIPLVAFDQMIRYAVQDEWSLHYRFYVPAETTNFNVIAYSCNGFSLSVDTTKFKGSLWYDILQKHSKIHYNVMLGGGDQIYSDSIRLYSKKVAHWIDTKNTVTKYTMKVDDEFRLDMENFYLKEYMEWYGFGHWHGAADNSRTTQRLLPLALATIPSINIWDDHDIIDGFGSYHHSFMQTDVFSSIGKAAYKYYMLFQHHVSSDDEEDKEAYLSTPNWVLGSQPGPYIGEKSHSVWTPLGPQMTLLGLDCRTERKLKQILAPETYALAFKRIEDDIKQRSDEGRPKLDHLLVMLGVPIAYPRLVWLEWLFSSRLLAPIKYLSKKGIVAPGLLNSFNGDVELLDDLNDHWCARYHKAERNFLISKLQDLGAKHGIRVTILSGDVHLAALGRFRSKMHLYHPVPTKRTESENVSVLENPEYDSRLIFNVISSAVVNTPPPDAMARLLQERNKLHHFDCETDEDSVPFFTIDTDGETFRRDNAFLNKRNWSDIIPMENVMNNDYLRDWFKVEIGDKIIPGINPNQCDDKTFVKLTKKHQEANDSKDETKRNQSYPVTERGVMASIHIETDTDNVDSQTTWYRLPIPELKVENETLSHNGMKHSFI